QGERLGRRRFARTGVGDDSEGASAGRLVSAVLIGILARGHRNILSSFVLPRRVRAATVARAAVPKIAVSPSDDRGGGACTVGVASCVRSESAHLRVGDV